MEVTFLTQQKADEMLQSSIDALASITEVMQGGYRTKDAEPLNADEFDQLVHAAHALIKCIGNARHLF